MLGIGLGLTSKTMLGGFGPLSPYGPELVRNGAFTDATDWTPQGQWSIANGKAAFTNGGLTQYIQQGGFTLQAGVKYTFEFDLLDLAGGNASIGLFDSAAAEGLVAYTTYAANGRYSVVFTPAATRTGLRIYGRNTSTSNFSITNVSIRTKNRHIFLLAGQSNMQGNAPYDGMGGHPDYVVQWNQNDTISPALVTLNHPFPGAGTMGADITFAQAYRAANPGVELLLVPCAEGSTGFTDGNWNPGNPQYERARLQAIDAVVKMGTSLKGILWVQGEQDANDSMTGAAYATALDAMIAGFRTHLGANLPFVAGQIPSLSNISFPTEDDINAAILALPGRVTKTAVAQHTGLTKLGDGVHYDAASLRTLGTRLYQAYASIA